MAIMRFLKAKRLLLKGVWQERSVIIFPSANYKSLFDGENDDIDTQNSYFWEINFEQSKTYLGLTPERIKKGATKWNNRNMKNTS
jgi:hypothetical protein